MSSRHKLSCVDIAADGVIRGSFVGVAWTMFSAIYSLRSNPHSVTVRSLLVESGGNALKMAAPLGVFMGFHCKLERTRGVKHWSNWALSGGCAGALLHVLETHSVRHMGPAVAIGALMGSGVGVFRIQLGVQDLT